MNDPRQLHGLGALGVEDVYSGRGLRSAMLPRTPNAALDRRAGRFVKP